MLLIGRYDCSEAISKLDMLTMGGALLYPGRGINLLLLV